MKNILRLSFFAGIAFIVVLISAVSIINNSRKPVMSSSVVTDAAGSTYRVHIEKDTTYAIVTDADGKIWGVDFDGQTVDLTATRVNLDEHYKQEDIPTQFTGQHVDYNADPNKYMDNQNGGQQNNSDQNSDQQNSAGTPDQNGGQQSNSDQSGVQQNTPDQNGGQQSGLQPYRIQKYQDVIAGGTYLLNVTMIENGVQEDPITMAVKNGNFYVSMSVEDMSAQMIYKADTDTTYMLMDFIKKYCEVPDDMLGEDMDMSQISKGFSVEGLDKTITVTETELNGNKVICESYIDDDGSEFLYYFDNNDMLVRRDKNGPDGSTDIMIFSQMTTEVSDSLFEIPSGYGYLNISWLLKMAGESL